MKMQLLSANTGQGHNSCALALGEALEAEGHRYAIEDVFSLVSPKLSKMISQGHDQTYRNNPVLSDKGYQFLESHPKIFSRKMPVYRLMSIGRTKVAQCVQAGGYDAVICTHVLAAMILTAALQKGLISPPSAFVATDYSCCPGINGTGLDRYFIPHQSLIQDFLDADVPPEKILVTGIPVGKGFFPADNKAPLKERFGLDPLHRHLLIMCGSMGCGPVPELVDGVASRLQSDWEITVVCGSNEALKAQLTSKYSTHPFIHIRGYERDMPSLLSSADLFLTKPGGLSTTEAAAAAVPMVLVDAVSGCEKSNLQHFLRTGAAYTADSPKKIVRQCLSLMNDPEGLDSMTDKMRSSARSCAATDIIHEMLRLVSPTRGK